MHVVSRKALRTFWEKHPEAFRPLDHWFRHVTRASWRSFADLRADYNSADSVGPFVVFNVGGNKYRLVATVVYDRRQLVFVRGVYTHAEYDRLELG